jgi:predicted acylesterase/phospholipase RssA
MSTFDIVFEGGGAKGVALSGGMEGFFAEGHCLGRLVGTSAGAITATNLAIGFSPQEILAGSKEKNPSGDPIYTSFNDTPGLTDEELGNSAAFHALNRLPLPMPARLESRLDLGFLRIMEKFTPFASMLSLYDMKLS